MNEKALTHIEFELIDSSLIKDRRACMVSIFRRFRKELGLNGKEVQSWVGPRPEEVELLYSEYRRRSEEDDREYSLHNDAEKFRWPEFEEPYVASDKSEEFGTYFHRMGDYEDMYQLRVFVSWHEASIRQAMEMYKLRMVDWLTVKELERCIEEMSYSRPIQAVAK